MKTLPIQTGVLVLLIVATGYFGWQRNQLLMLDRQLNEQLSVLQRRLPSQGEQLRLLEHKERLRSLFPAESEQLHWQLETVEVLGTARDVWHFLQNGADAQGYWLGWQFASESADAGIWRLHFAQAGSGRTAPRPAMREWTVEKEDFASEEQELNSLSFWRLAGYYFDRSGAPIVHLVHVESGDWTTLALSAASDCGRVQLMGFTELDQGAARAMISEPGCTYTLTLTTEVAHVR